MLEGSLGEVYEYFPFWTDEEVRALRVEKYRAMLEHMAGNRRAAAEEETAAAQRGEASGEASESPVRERKRL